MVLHLHYLFHHLLLDCLVRAQDVKKREYKLLQPRRWIDGFAWINAEATEVSSRKK